LKLGLTITGFASESHREIENFRVENNRLGYTTKAFPEAAGGSEWLFGKYAEGDHKIKSK
jgi:hypothetical protein